MVKGNLRSTCSSRDSVCYLCCFPVWMRAHVSLTSNLEANTYWPTSTKLAVETQITKYLKTRQMKGIALAL